MDEENQNDGIIKKAGDALKKGAKDQAKKSMQKVFKKMIVAIAPILLKFVAIVLVVAILFTAISDFLDEIKGKRSKEANGFAVHYAGVSTEEDDEDVLNRIIVDTNNVTEDGAYKLTYEFRDKNGNLYSEQEAIENIKKDLNSKNKDLNITQFTDAEIKIIGTLMYNGLQVNKYNEDELKALALFVKADIASQSFDLRPSTDADIDIDTLRENDEVYGTLELHKTAVEFDQDNKVKYDENGNIVYKSIKLEYIPYGDEGTRWNILLYGCTKR